MNQLPPDPSKGGSTNSGRFSDNTGSSDSSFHQENSSNSPYEQFQYYSDPQRHSPASEPTYPQEYQTRKRLGRPPKKGKDKKLAPRSQTISPNNSTPTGISQVQINDNDLMQMNQLQACQFQIPIISPSGQLPTQIGLNGNDCTITSGQSNIPLAGVPPILPVPPQGNLMSQVMYPNSKLSINQRKVQYLTAAKNQLISFDNEILDFLLKLFEIPNQSLSKQQKIESFSSFMSNIIYTIPQNLNEYIFFLLQQLSNKSNSPLYQQFINPQIPTVFQQSSDQKVIYKFAPLNKNLEIPLNPSINSEYAIIATIIPSNTPISDYIIIVNGSKCNPSNFGEDNDRIYYLISNMSKKNDLTGTIPICLNQKIYQSFCWVAFYYVVPNHMSQIERYANVTPPIKGVRTTNCSNTCLFNFYDVINKIYSFGFSICPRCHQNIYLSKLIQIKPQFRISSLDQVANSLSYQFDSSVINHYDYFSRKINLGTIISDDDKDSTLDENGEEEEDFDPDKFIEDIENECSNAMTNFSLS